MGFLFAHPALPVQAASSSKRMLYRHEPPVFKNPPRKVRNVVFLSFIMNPLPTRIDKYSDSEMLVSWSSGESFAVPFLEIRFHCPCASCVDEHTGQRILKREQISRDIRPVNVQLVGRYAVQVTWSDGHGTGMYHYDRLLQLCEKFGKALSS